MLFHSQRKFRSDSNLLIHLGDKEIEQVQEFKYLGIILDPALNFKAHVSYLTKKVKQRTSLLWRIRNVVSTNLATKLYNTMINPLFTYCSFIYDGCGQGSARELEILQNNALRAVRKVNYMYSATALHNELDINWLDVNRKIACCSEVYKYVNGTGPSTLVDMLKEKPTGRSLRSDTNKLLRKPRTRTKMAENDFAIRAIGYWDTVPLEIRTESSLKNFKKRLKSENIFEHVR